jgi:hypothetical protein
MKTRDLSLLAELEPALAKNVCTISTLSSTRSGLKSVLFLTSQPLVEAARTKV